MASTIELIPLTGLPEVEPGQDLAEILLQGLREQVRLGDVLVVTHKVVSKAEGRVVNLEQVQPSPWSRRWAEKFAKDPRQVEVVLGESSAILRMEHGIIISRTAHGLVCANAGVDRSNSPGDNVCLLPIDPDASAAHLSQHCSQALGYLLPVLISDSFGRAWRVGIVNVAIGLSGLEAFSDYRGQADPHGYPLEASLMASADALCAAAELAMGKVAGIPAVLVRGFAWTASKTSSASQLLRPAEQDFFR